MPNSPGGDTVVAVDAGGVVVAVGRGRRAVVALDRCPCYPRRRSRWRHFPRPGLSPLNHSRSPDVLLEHLLEPVLWLGPFSALIERRA